MEVEVEVMDDERLKGEERIFPLNSPTFWSYDMHMTNSIWVFEWPLSIRVKRMKFSSIKSNVNNFDV